MLIGLVAEHVLLDLVADGTQFLLLSILLGSGADLKLTLLHSTAVAVLLLHGEGNLVSELLASLVSLAVLGLVLAAVKVNGEDAGPVLNNLFLVPAILGIYVHALEVILGGDVQVVHGVTDARHLRE